jgi:hypothetical protein
VSSKCQQRAFYGPVGTITLRKGSFATCRRHPERTLATTTAQLEWALFQFNEAKINAS